MKSIALFGECMIELQGRVFGTMRQTFGGDTLNTAVYLARSSRRQDLRVCYATALGTDAYSDAMLAAWSAEGLDTGLVRRLPDRVPGLYTIQVDERGERTFTYWRDQSAARAYFDTPATPLETAAPGLDALHVSGISLAILAPAARARLYGVMRTLRERGARVSFDNNYRPRLWPDAAAARDAFEAALALSDTALLTLDDEAALFGDASVEGALARARGAGVAEVIIKRGSDPTLVSVAGQPNAEVATQRIERVVDTTAAGDSFAGAFLAARLAGAPAADAAAAGNRLAAIVIQHPGAIIDPAFM